MSVGFIDFLVHAAFRVFIGRTHAAARFGLERGMARMAEPREY